MPRAQAPAIFMKLTMEKRKLLSTHASLELTNVLLKTLDTETLDLIIGTLQQDGGERGTHLTIVDADNVATHLFPALDLNTISALRNHCISNLIVYLQINKFFVLCSPYITRRWEIKGILNRES